MTIKSWWHYNAKIGLILVHPFFIMDGYWIEPSEGLSYLVLYAKGNYSVNQKIEETLVLLSNFSVWTTVVIINNTDCYSSLKYMIMYTNKPTK